MHGSLNRLPMLTSRIALAHIIEWLIPERLFPLFLFVAGALGALVRYGLASRIQPVHGVGFPWDILVVNAVGCLVFGFFWSFSTGGRQASRFIQLVVLIGFLGSFTTFATFAFDNVDLARSNRWLAAAVNLTLLNLLSFVALAIGIYLASVVKKTPKL